MPRGERPAHLDREGILEIAIIKFALALWLASGQIAAGFLYATVQRHFGGDFAERERLPDTIVSFAVQFLGPFAFIIALMIWDDYGYQGWLFPGSRP